MNGYKEFIILRIKGDKCDMVVREDLFGVVKCDMVMFFCKW